MGFVNQLMTGGAPPCRPTLNLKNPPGSIYSVMFESNAALKKGISQQGMSDCQGAHLKKSEADKIGKGSSSDVPTYIAIGYRIGHPGKVQTWSEVWPKDQKWRGEVSSWAFQPPVSIRLRSFECITFQWSDSVSGPLLVGGFKHILFFHWIWCVIHKHKWLRFFRGVETINQVEWVRIYEAMFVGKLPYPKEKSAMSSIFS